MLKMLVLVLSAVLAGGTKPATATSAPSPPAPSAASLAAVTYASLSTAAAPNGYATDHRSARPDDNRETRVDPGKPLVIALAAMQSDCGTRSTDKDFGDVRHQRAPLIPLRARSRGRTAAAHLTLKD